MFSPNKKIKLESSGDTFVNEMLLNKIIQNIYTEESADVFFMFEGCDERVPAHKALLSSVSPVFNAMFNGDLKEKGDVKITDTSPAAFKEFLQFSHSESVKLTATNIERVLYCIDKYDMPDSMRICEQFMISKLTTDNVCWNLHLSLIHNLERLKMECFNKAREKTKEVLQSASFMSSSRAVIKSLLELPKLSCDETVVFDACIKWAKEMCRNQQIDESGAANLRAQLNDCFSLIRFDEMSLIDFTSRLTSNKGMFNASELETIFEKILANVNGKKQKRHEEKPPIIIAYKPSLAIGRHLLHYKNL